MAVPGDAAEGLIDIQNGTVSRRDHDAFTRVGKHTGGKLQLFLVQLALGDVQPHHALNRQALNAHALGDLQLGPKEAGVRLQEAQLAGLRFGATGQLAMVQVVNVLVLRTDELRERLLDQHAPVPPEQGTGGQVDIENEAGCVQNAIAHRSEFKQVFVARSGGLQLRLHLAQLFVLHLQLDLMHTQFKQSFLQRIRGADRPGFPSRAKAAIDLRLRPLTQRLRRHDGVGWLVG